MRHRAGVPHNGRPGRGEKPEEEAEFVVRHGERLAVEHWRKTDMMVEVGSTDNARAIHQHLRQIGVHLFAQKLGWSEVTTVDEMPVNYRDGSLFITRQPSRPR